MATKRTSAATQAALEHHLEVHQITTTSPYVTSLTSMQFTCPYHHQWQSTPSGMLAHHSGCRVCSIFAMLQRHTYSSVLARQTALFKYAKQHGIVYHLPKPTVPYKNRAHACQVVHCEPTQDYMAHIIEAHHLPWDVATLQQVVVAVEKWKFTTFPDKMIKRHKETMVAVILYWWCQTHGIHYSQVAIGTWVGITEVTLRKWLRLLTPFFETLEREILEREH